MLDARSSAVTWFKWLVLFLLGYFLLHPVAGIYEKSDYRDVVFMLTFMAGVMGVDVPITPSPQGVETGCREGLALGAA